LVDRVRDMAWLRGLMGSRRWPAEVDRDALALALLDNFPSPDPVLRDELSYTLLATLVESGQLQSDTVRTLIRRAVDDAHLFHGIGNREDPSVFGRAFSVLVVPLVLDVPNARRALHPEDIAAARSAVLRYTYEERDRRGYVPGQGWAHTAAHTADALGALGLDPGVDDTGPILDALRHLATLPDPLAFGEDDRIAWAAFQLVRSGRVTDGACRVWLKEFQPVPHGEDVAAAVLADANAAHVLRSFYFRLLSDNPRHPALGAALQAVRRFDPFAGPKA
jgi:hypothetical protein